MRRPGWILIGSSATVVLAAGILYACGEALREPTSPTPPNFARAKTDRTVTITGGGTGSGHVRAQVLDEPAFDCYIVSGKPEDPSNCSQLFPWKSTVTLTATSDVGSTFTGWGGACTGTATSCKLMMTVARSVQANFSGSGGASYALSVLGAGTGNGTVRSQTGLTPAINCTITAGTPSGTCTATYPSGTGVTLSAIAASGHSFEGWSGACTGPASSCTVSVTSATATTAMFSAPAGPEATVGKWDAPVSYAIVGLHLSHLSDGRLLMWGHGGDPQTWSSTTGFQPAPFTSCTDPTTCKLFCSGHTFLADGRLLVAGGHNEVLGNGYGLKQASIFNGSSWSSTASMTYGRWYPTLVELADGQVVAISGSQEPSLNASYPERYNGSSWTTLTGASLALPNYPRAFVEPKSGRIFYAGESSSRYLDPSGAGVWSTTGLGNAGSHVRTDRSYGNAVMIGTKVFYIGGGGGGDSCSSPPQNTAEVVDLNAGTPTWSLIPTTMSFRRRQANATVLPDGTVLVTGGTSACGFTSEAGAVYAPELFQPATNTWTTLANASVVRVYHSTTTLLPDGRVLSTGSGDGAGVTSQYSYEVFSPPYLFKGARPTYTLASAQLHYGVPFTVTTPNATAISKVTIVRLTSTTHAFDAGQRLNTLSFQIAADGQSLTVTPPAAGRLAPPGPYMLFILNVNGVPSVAQTVMLN
jgi:hypothetical protein